MKMPKYICYKVIQESKDGFRLASVPSENVEEVVRCKDCKFYTSMIPSQKIGICDLNVHHMGDDGFCSCGERLEVT